jgi:hypothetical protein
MQTADTDQVASVIPGRQMNGFTLEVISFGPTRLIPWFPQDFPPECVLGLELRFSCWRTDEHGGKSPSLVSVANAKLAPLSVKPP